MTATGLLRNSMINEEGGIDPEQFRMEAMFDRMDCVGKAHPGPDHPVRPVPRPQVRPADAGRVLPDVRLPEQCTRGQHRGLHAGERQKIAEIAQDSRDRRRCSAPEPRLAERMAAWEKQVAAQSADWVIVRPEVDEESTGGQKYIADGRRLVPRPGIRTDQAHGENDGQDHARADQRPFAWNCSTTRTCRWAGPGGRSRGRGP